MHDKQDKPQSAIEVLRFFDWALRQGQAMAEELDYVPLPDSLVASIEASWQASIRDAAGKPLWPARAP